MAVKIRFSKTDALSGLDYKLKSAVRAAVEEALAYEGLEFDAEVSVTFTTNEKIASLNAKYRKKNSPTDVLSFPLYEQDELLSLGSEEYAALGDIVISVERAEQQACEIGNSFIREVAFLTVHSMLHLLGYDHEISPEEDEIQTSAQKEIIESIEKRIGKL